MFFTNYHVLEVEGNNTNVLQTNTEYNVTGNETEIFLSELYDSELDNYYHIGFDSDFTIENESYYNEHLLFTKSVEGDDKYIQVEVYNNFNSFNVTYNNGNSTIKITFLADKENTDKNLRLVVKTEPTDILGKVIGFWNMNCVLSKDNSTGINADIEYIRLQKEIGNISDFFAAYDNIDTNNDNTFITEIKFNDGGENYQCGIYTLTINYENMIYTYEIDILEEDIDSNGSLLDMTEKSFSRTDCALPEGYYFNTIEEQYHSIYVDDSYSIKNTETISDERGSYVVLILNSSEFQSDFTPNDNRRFLSNIYFYSPDEILVDDTNLGDDDYITRNVVDTNTFSTSVWDTIGEIEDNGIITFVREVSCLQIGEQMLLYTQNSDNEIDENSAFCLIRITEGYKLKNDKFTYNMTVLERNNDDNKTTTEGEKIQEITKIEILDVGYNWTLDHVYTDNDEYKPYVYFMRTAKAQDDYPNFKALTNDSKGFEFSIIVISEQLMLKNLEISWVYEIGIRGVSEIPQDKEDFQNNTVLANDAWGTAFMENADYTDYDSNTGHGDTVNITYNDIIFYAPDSTEEDFSITNKNHIRILAADMLERYTNISAYQSPLPFKDQVLANWLNNMYGVTSGQTVIQTDDLTGYDPDNTIIIWDAMFISTDNFTQTDQDFHPLNFEVLVDDVDMTTNVSAITIKNSGSGYYPDSFLSTEITYLDSNDSNTSLSNGQGLEILIDEVYVKNTHGWLKQENNLYANIDANFIRNNYGMFSFTEKGTYKIKLQGVIKPTINNIQIPINNIFDIKIVLKNNTPISNTIFEQGSSIPQMFLISTEITIDDVSNSEEIGIYIRLQNNVKLDVINGTLLLTFERIY